MDFSLLQPDARYPYLRDIVAIKRRWMYYAVMVLDPILRFGWIFYAIFTYDAQHSTIVSFLVALSEVTRRGMWALFRVENEHCANVAQYKASRDIPLPYHLETEPLTQRASIGDDVGGLSLHQHTSGAQSAAEAAGAGSLTARTYDSTGADPTRDDEAMEGGLRRRKPQLNRAKSIRNMIASAHRQDFQKKRRSPEADAGAGHGEGASPDGEFVNPSDDEDDDDDDTASAINERFEISRVEGLVRGESSCIE